MRRSRIHRPGELYYLVRRSNGSEPLFRDAQDCAHFQSVLARAVRACEVTIYAFCLLPQAFHLAVRVANVSTSQLMHFVSRYYARGTHLRKVRRSARFGSHYRAVLVDGEYLRELVRYIVWASVRAGYAERVASWQHSSHWVYVGSARMPWLDSAAVLAAFDPNVELARRQYAEFVASPTEEFFARGFRRGLPGEPRVFGSAALLRRLGLDVQPALSHSLEDAVQSICWYCGITREQLKSGRDFAYARALMAWYVRQRQPDGLVAAARYLQRHWSTLQSAINLYQARAPELFDVEAIRRAGPLVPPRGAPVSVAADAPADGER